MSNRQYPLSNGEGPKVLTIPKHEVFVNMGDSQVNMNSVECPESYFYHLPSGYSIHEITDLLVGSPPQLSR